MSMYIVQATASIVVLLLLSLSAQSDDPATNSNVCEGIFNICCSLPKDAESTGTVLSLNDKKCVYQNENGESIGGACFPYYQCKERTRTLITDGHTIMDIKSIDAEYTNRNERFETKCAPKSDTSTPSPNQLSQHSACGFQNVNSVGYGLNDTSAKQSEFGEFPWTAAVLKKAHTHEKEAFVLQCGASLIHPSVVLTAAHCANRSDPSSLTIRLGEWDALTKTEPLQHQDRKVAEVIIHEEHTPDNLANDIALLLLDEPVELSDNVRTVCLPPQDFNFDGSRCFASGWGKDNWGKQGRNQATMKKIDMPIVPSDLCEETLRTTQLGHYFNLHRSFICAGGEQGTDTYIGDGGSPLACPIPSERERFHQAGIVAWGVWSSDTKPGAYVNVAHFKNWIDEKFQCKNLDSSYYTSKL